MPAPRAQGIFKVRNYKLKIKIEFEMKVVIVESPSKAKTINKYLGADYKVIASFGHIRDLPSKSGSVRPQEDFAMTWQIDEASERHVKDILKALKGADTLYLATDPDREGEAISWHVLEVLKEHNVLKNMEVKRVAFYEITKKAIVEAIKNPRDLDQNLIEAYLARRALDYLVGFTLSPLLWTKLPGSKSAGRVQSVALRLVADREGDIERFKTQEYWSLEADFLTPKSHLLSSRLFVYDGKKIEKFSFPNQATAFQAKKEIEAKAYRIGSIDPKEVKRHPAAPFITSTLQQEASRKLRFSARKTMQIAQRLYEGIDLGGETVGLITYMRTDSVNLSKDAITETRQLIETLYGNTYVPKAPKTYKTKAKNAQEAHEAIRPTDVAYTPEKLKTFLEADQWALYSLIWKRTVACQMESALFNQVSIDVVSDDHLITFRATGSTLIFDGFLKVYEEGRDEEDDDKTSLLPKVDVNDALALKEAKAEQHFTQPPPRYTEASLVKKLEELGIGRPSTYATIMGTLLERKYVRLDKRALIPESLGRLVTSFLTEYFPKYVEYDFTATMEQTLDGVAHGEENWSQILKTFWGPFHEAAEAAKTLRISDVLTMLDQALSSYLFPESVENNDKDPRICPKCTQGRLHLKLSKFGGFIGCSRYPECDYTRQFTQEIISGTEDGGAPTELTEPRTLGVDEKTGETITVRKGPYGFYLQWGEGTKEKKPKRAPLPKGRNPLEITLGEALELTALPKNLGSDPQTNDDISIGQGRFGPYVKYGKSFASIPKGEDPLSVTLPRALEIVALAKAKAALKEKTTPKENITIKEMPEKTKTPRKTATAKASTTTVKAVTVKKTPVKATTKTSKTNP